MGLVVDWNIGGRLYRICLYGNDTFIQGLLGLFDQLGYHAGTGLWHTLSRVYFWPKRGDVSGLLLGHGIAGADGDGAAFFAKAKSLVVSN